MLLRDIVVLYIRSGIGTYSRMISSDVASKHAGNYLY